MINLEFDASGNGFAIGWSDGLLYSVNKATGTATSIGPTGIYNNMDLAFNPAGILYATVSNNLWTINTATGAATSLGTITGVCPYGTIMGIMFDANGVLYATNYAGSSNSCLMTIDLGTLAATTVGFTGMHNPHGGDIP